MAVVVMQPTAGQAPPAASRVLAAAGLASRTVPLADDAGPSAGLAGVEGLIVLGAADPALLREALAAEVPVLALEPGTRLLVRAAGGAPGGRPDATPDRPPVELTRADDLLAEGNLRRTLRTTGWYLDGYEYGAGHFLARAVPRG
ncbi:hypothetical protein [Streptomyces virginiae]|uniref:hypothetical protein n=1 Tax=Streptomyces virginiae TaxID=1961 RepID=UPI0022542216|nr:hypothetical protein [Streptomyces virginiae]MCX4717523.1 hypothetical protein [Streptomyces virginiae]MCX5277374.1 hypothetical protein [Streptomyces virginiae]